MHCHGHGHGRAPKRKRMTCHVGNIGHEITLTTPNISKAVARVMDEKRIDFERTLHGAEELIATARNMAEQSANIAKDWREERDAQFERIGKYEEQVLKKKEELEESNEQKEKVLQKWEDELS